MVFKFNDILRSSPIDKFGKSLFKLCLLKPSGVEWHHIWSPVLSIMTVEIFLQPFQNLIRVVVEEDALVHVGTVTPFETLDEMSIQWQLPDSGEASSWTCPSFTVMRDGVVKGVRPDGDFDWRYSHRTVPNESKILKNLRLSYKLNRKKLFICSKKLYWFLTIKI
ncbi:hypothetical protein Fcan01_12384 [Folsomia candida]|uniref:Uncharacterized protein n=1 Tax=Folsomia candida TaxID=158441 RepID=A0A226E5Z8_FOLCA|nr:hypothetical protein Fcan01_12384 [Folsomia candida]